MTEIKTEIKNTKFSLLVLGDASVGKTSLIKMYGM